MRAKIGGGYSANTAKQYTDFEEGILLLSKFWRPSFIYKDGKRTDDVKGYSLNFGVPSIDGMGDILSCRFSVDFAEKHSKTIEDEDGVKRDAVTIPYGSAVEFDGLKALEMDNNVYFQADGVKVVKS